MKKNYVKGWKLKGGGVERGENLGKEMEKEMREEENIVMKGKEKIFEI